jgi:peptidoglycan/LPS O-acetylase OafA/YrhL
VELHVSRPDDGHSAPERLHALDAVRGFALLLGIVFHASGSFVPAAAPFWGVEDRHRTAVLAVVYFTTHVFRMTTFFLIAGFFGHMSFHRRGARGFIRDRLKRIALPLAVGWPIMFLAMFALPGWPTLSADGAHASAAHGSWPPRFDLTHLWFLYVLLEFYAAILILRAGVAWIDRRGRVRAGLDASVAFITRSALGSVVLGLPLAAVFLADPRWLMWFGVPTPSVSLITGAKAWVNYGAAFAFGWALHRQADLLQVLQRRWATNLGLAVALTAASLAIAGLTPPAAPIDDLARSLAGALCYALATWTSTFAVIGVALQFLSDYSAARRYIADSSYWLYLVHFPIVVALQMIVARLDWPWPLKFAAILTVAFSLMYVSYQRFVRYGAIGAILNGPRKRLIPAEVAPRGGVEVRQETT